MSITATIVGREAVIARFKKISEGVRGRMVAVMDQVGADIQQHIVENKLSGNPLKRQTGALSRSINKRVENTGPDSLSAVVAANTPYAAPLEYGSAPHTITPRDAMVLCFTVGGKKVFAKSVNHPGNREYAFMRSSLAEKAPFEIQRIRDEMQALIEESRA